MSNNEKLCTIYIQTLNNSITLSTLQHKTNAKHMPECDECNVILQKYLRCDTTSDRSHGINAIDAIIVPIDVSGTTNYNLKMLDLLELKIESIIIVGYHLDTIDPITVRVDEFAIINYNGVVRIVTVSHHNGLIFDAMSYTYMILIILDAIHRNCTQKSNTSSGGSYNLSRHGIIRYIFSKTIATRVMIEHCHKYGLNENGSINKKHIFNLIITVINVIDTIAYQIEILAVSVPVIDETLSSMVTRTSAISIRFQFNLYLDGTASLSLYFITIDIYDFCPIVFVFISMVAIRFRADHIYIMLIMIVSVISIYKLDKTRNNGYKTSITNWMELMQLE